MSKQIVITLIAAATLSAFTLLPEEKPKKSGVDISSMNTSINPRDDFYNYAGGMWIKKNPVPAEEARWGSFDELKKSNDINLKKILEIIAAEKTAPLGSNHQKLRDFYLSAMDTVKIENAGIASIKKEMEMINSISNKVQLIEVVADLQKKGINTMFGFYVTRDLKKSDQYIAYIGQGGYHLPDKDYYLNDDEKSVRIRSEYTEHIARMFELTKVEGSSEKAKKILEMETSFAKVCKSRVELRDQEKNYFKYSPNELKTLTPNLNLSMFFDKVGAKGITEVIVRQPEFFTALDNYFNNYTLEDWKIYLTWDLLDNSANFLSKNFVQEDFAFNQGVLNGVQQMKPRWKEVLNSANATIGEIIGQAYVEKYFSAQSKQRVQQMVNYILEVYKTRIQNVDWMSNGTKEKALEKLSLFNTKLGYTDKWRDYSKLEIKRDSYISNVMRASEFQFDYMVSRLGKPVDKTEWQMLPHTINAYFEPTLKERRLHNSCRKNNFI